MRFASSLPRIAASLLLAAMVSDQAAARSQGFYLHGAYYRESPPQPAQPRRAAGPVATIPMPVPRPRFPSDPPAAAPADVASAPKEPPPAKPAEADKPAPRAVPAQNPAESAAAAKTAPAQPAVAPSGAATTFTPRSPDDDPACPQRLAGRHVDAQTAIVGPQPDQRCSIVQPVRLTGLVLPDGSTVAFPDRPTIACTTADVFSLYVRDLLSPLAKGTYNASLSAVWTGPGFECRSRDHIFGAKLSAHGQGLAVDIAQLKLADGRLIAVGDPKTDSDTAFETAARAGGCGYFHTVLGPGSDSYHRTHWHFDLEVRGAKGDSKYCK